MLALSQSGCGVLYVAQAARGQWQVMAARRPISDVIADPQASPELVHRLEQVRAARAFATHDLDLPDNKSYTTYADINRDYVVWNVVATPEFSVEPRQWCFPIAGCVAYRGYFSEQRARKFAAHLERNGDDVLVEGVPAYSTLGKFADPVLSTMLGYGADELVGTIFHELAHQVVYLPGDTAFNEAFAVTVEQEGLARWLARQHRPQDAALFEQRLAVRSAVVAVVMRYRVLLTRLYGETIPDHAKRARKREIFAQLAAEIAALELAAGVHSRWVRDLAADPNNARLATLATYYDCVPGLQHLLELQQHDLAKFYQRVREAARATKLERHAEFCSPKGAL